MQKPHAAVETWTGKHFHLLAPSPQSVDIRDIAHHLSLENRFCGATKLPISVAQHCLIVASLVPAPLKRHALCHDAEEAYIGDWAKPVKSALACLEMWWRLDHYFIEPIRRAINEALVLLPLTEEEEQEIKHADNLAARAEADFFIPSRGLEWPWGDVPLVEVAIEPITAIEAELRFLAEWDRLNGTRPYYLADRAAEESNC